jgi:outer membrane usher protein FimD/PapC
MARLEMQNPKYTIDQVISFYVKSVATADTRIKYTDHMYRELTFREKQRVFLDNENSIHKFSEKFPVSYSNENEEFFTLNIKSNNNRDLKDMFLSGFETTYLEDRSGYDKNEIMVIIENNTGGASEFPATIRYNYDDSGGDNHSIDIKPLKEITSEKEDPNLAYFAGAKYFTIDQYADNVWIKE